MELPPYLTVVNDRVLVDVFVQPRAATDLIVGLHGRSLKLKVRAPALEGRANEAVVKLVARTLGVAPRQVSIVKGEGGRNKRLEVSGTTVHKVISELARVVSSHAHEPG
jgi:uncharacterized protein (TIGR00251 family)